MGSKHFVDNKLRKKLQKDMKKRSAIENKINALQEQLKDVDNEINYDLEDFYMQVDDETVISVLQHYEKHGGKKKKQVVKEIEERYSNEDLLIEDTLNLIDWYEKMCDYYNNKM